MSFEQELELIRKRSGTKQQVNEYAEQKVQQAMITLQQALGVMYANKESAMQAIQQLAQNPANKAYATALTALLGAAGKAQLGPQPGGTGVVDLSGGR